MPKKTRKQKIAAAKRKLSASHQIKAISQENISVAQSATEKLTEENNIKRPKIQTLQTQSLTVINFKKDLRKSSVLGLVILSAQIGLYVLQQKYYLDGLQLPFFQKL